MLENIHSAHQGIEKSTQNASDTLFWPSMRMEIKNSCERCDICAQYAAQHQKEPMLHQPIPDLPWQFVSKDIFQYESSHYLVTVDHYSDYFEMDLLPDTLSSTVIQMTKSVFARHWCPMLCLTDNGPQFISSEYASTSLVPLTTAKVMDAQRPQLSQPRTYSKSVKTPILACFI